MKRRDFLRNFALASLGLQLGLPNLAGAATPESVRKAGRQASRLVVIHLFGGNDGLNTIVPANDPLYRQFRPQLALSPQICMDVGQGLYFHPALAPLLPLWSQGRLAVVNGVGYPESNHSHFISSDIWHGGGPHQALGWLGRAADLGELATVQLARSDQARALWADKHPPLCIDPEQSQTPQQLDPVLTQLYGKADHLGLTFADMGRLDAKLEKCNCPGEGLKAKDLALSLRWIAELIPEARVFHTTMSGFDTHSDQLNRHHNVLGQLATALTDFWKVLEERGWAESTTVMVFSEFGRRVEENRSGGTDHGTAGPVFLLGQAVRGGWLGEYPSLSQLDEGDFRFQVDFRQVYAGILEHWLELDSVKILGERFSPLSCFV